MKRIVFIIALLVSVISSYAQVRIQLEDEGSGTYKIQCKVNGAKMRMILDTGASVVCLSRSMAEYLYDNGYLKDGDFIGSSSAQIADGSIVKATVVNIRDIEIEGLHLKEVTAMISDSQTAPLLLGMTAIRKLGTITIQGNTLIVQNAKNDYTEQDIINLDEKSNQAFEEENYEAAIDYLLQIHKIKGLSLYGFNRLIIAYTFINDLAKAEEYTKQAELTFEVDSENQEDWCSIYHFMAILNNYNHYADKAIYYEKKEISILEKCNDTDKLILAKMDLILILNENEYYQNTLIECNKLQDLLEKIRYSNRDLYDSVSKMITSIKSNLPI